MAETYNEAVEKLRKIVADIENRKLGRKSSSDEFDRFFIGFFSDNNNG